MIRSSRRRRLHPGRSCQDLRSGAEPGVVGVGAGDVVGEVGGVAAQVGDEVVGQRADPLTLLARGTRRRSARFSRRGRRRPGRAGDLDVGVGPLRNSSMPSARTRRCSRRACAAVGDDVVARSAEAGPSSARPPRSGKRRQGGQGFRSGGANRWVNLMLLGRGGPQPGPRPARASASRASSSAGRGSGRDRGHEGGPQPAHLVGLEPAAEPELRVCDGGPLPGSVGGHRTRQRPGRARRRGEARPPVRRHGPDASRTIPAGSTCGRPCRCRRRTAKQ